MERMDERHQELAELLAAYADGELDAGRAAQVEAHLLGCGRCRRALDVQVAIRSRLAAEPIRPAAPALRVRVLAAALAGSPMPGSSPPAAGRRTAASWAGWVLAAALAGLLLLPPTRPRVRGPAPGGQAQVQSGLVVRLPMVEDALADYRRLAGRELPRGSTALAEVQARVPFPVVPLDAPGLRLISAWTTEIRGQPAAALAYRWGDRVVIQYVISEELFFRQPVVRDAVAAAGRFVVADGAQSLVAWPGARSGSLLVGDVPPHELAALPT